MQILVLSFYFPPDLSAGSFRIAAFLRALEEELPANSVVDVMTTLPNRYHSFSPEAPSEESTGMVTVRRFRTSTHQSGMRRQAQAFLAFAWQVLWKIRGRKYDLVYATTSRLFTGWLGAICARLVQARLYLDIRDIFIESIGDVINGRILRLIMPVLDRIERMTIRAADGINLISKGFLDYFMERYPGKEFATIPNGIDVGFQRPLNSPERDNGNERRCVLYAGNIGQGQGLHRIIPELAEKSGPNFHFRVIGDGGMRRALERALMEKSVENVELIPPVPRDDLRCHYADADVLFIHLNDFPAFRRVLPSKLFEYAATGKPILAGVGGYAASFLHEEVENVVVFPPCDAEAARKALQCLRYVHTDRSEFVARYRRDVLMKRLVEDVLVLTA